jgi:hypothetical protein
MLVPLGYHWCCKMADSKSCKYRIMVEVSWYVECAVMDRYFLTAHWCRKKTSQFCASDSRHQRLKILMI